MTSSLKIIPYNTDHLEKVLDLSIRAWTPVFPKVVKQVPEYVYEAFYPNGWEMRQRADIAAACEDDEISVWLAVEDEHIKGFVALKFHQEDSMGEIYIIAVDPECQRQGVSTELMTFAFDRMRENGLTMAMVETGGDEGHAPSRATYESAGFERYPVARYFREL